MFLSKGQCISFKMSVTNFDDVILPVHPVYCSDEFVTDDLELLPLPLSSHQLRMKLGDMHGYQGASTRRSSTVRNPCGPTCSGNVTKWKVNGGNISQNPKYNCVDTGKQVTYLLRSSSYFHHNFPLKRLNEEIILAWNSPFKVYEILFSLSAATFNLYFSLSFPYVC